MSVLDFGDCQLIVVVHTINFGYCSIHCNCPDNWFRVLSISLNCLFDFGDCQLIVVVHTINFGNCSIHCNCPDNWFRVLSISWNCLNIWFLVLSIKWNFQTIDFGGWKLVGIVRTTICRGRSQNQFLAQCHDLVPNNCILIDTFHWIDTTRNPYYIMR